MYGALNAEQNKLDQTNKSWEKIHENPVFHRFSDRFPVPIFTDPAEEHLSRLQGPAAELQIAGAGAEGGAETPGGFGAGDPEGPGGEWEPRFFFPKCFWSFFGCTFF